MISRRGSVMPLLAVLLALIAVATIMFQDHVFFRNTVPTKFPTPTLSPLYQPSVKNVFINTTSNWAECLNEDLNIKVKIPPKWKCEVDKQPDTNEHNIILTRSDGEQISLVDAYPTEYDPNIFSNKKEAVKIAEILLNKQYFGIYFWPKRTSMGTIFEQITYDKVKWQKNYLKGIFYVVSNINYQKLTSLEKKELQQLFDSISLIQG